MIHRVYAQKDTFITNYQLKAVQRTGSNFGNSEILHLYKVAGVSGAVGVTATSSLARILTQFDLTQFSTVPSGSSYYLRLADARHNNTLPSSFNVEIQALSRSWDEGRGRDVDLFADKGYANWMKATADTYWTTPGGDTTGPINVAHFDEGDEDLLVNVTDIVQQWMSGNISNNGMMVRLTSTQETDGLDYYLKMFHGRETFFPDRRPYIEARWDSFVADNRNNFLFDVSGTLFMHHVVRGELTNLTAVGTGSIGVKITDTSGTIMYVTGSHTGRTGVYSASFLVPTGSYSGSLFEDIWFNLSTPSIWYNSGTFGIGDDVNLETVDPKRYYVNVNNLRNSYQTDETVRMRLFIRPHDYNPARVLTASLDSHGIVVAKAYYRIVNDRTSEDVVPYGTGSLQHTRLSYDGNGNYFDFYMGCLSPGNVYRISFLFDVDGQRQYVDQGFKFRVV